MRLAHVRPSLGLLNKHRICGTRYEYSLARYIPVSNLSIHIHTMLPPSPSGLHIRRAERGDIPKIQHMVKAAYEKYVSRIGRPPAPMTADYGALMATHDVFVALPVDAYDIVGSIVLRADEETKTMHMNNVVVDPSAQGKGYGRALLDCAEAWAKMKECTEMALFTNVRMVENLVLYPKMGYTEVERKTEDGFERVYFRKRL